MQVTALLSRRGGAIILLGALVIALGAYLSFRIDRHAAPSLVPPHLVITTLSPQTVLEDMQDKATIPQERTLNGMPGLTRLQSVTSAGQSILIAEIAPGVDLEHARAEASARVVRAPLPPGAGPLAVARGVAGLTPEQPVMLLALWSTDPHADLTDLTKLARESVLPRLLAFPQVQSAALVGEERLQVVAELDPAKMRSSGVGFEQIAALVRFNNVALPTGSLRAQDQNTPVLTFNEPTSVQALEDLVVGLAQTSPLAPPTQVRLKDVARVSVVPKDGAGVFRVDGGAAVGIRVYAHPTGDLLQAAKAIRQAVASINSELEEISPDVYLETLMDRTRPTARALRGLEWLVLIGGAASVGLVTLLLFSLRAGLTVALALAASVGAGVIIAYLAGQALTPVTAAGFALAVAFALPPIVLTAEAAWRHARSGVPAPLAPWTAVREVALTCLAMSLAQVVALLPLAFSTHPTGTLLRPMLLPLAATSIAALAAALVLVPALAQALLSLARPGSLLGPASLTASGARWLLSAGARAKAVALLLAAAAFGGSLALLLPLSSSLLPLASTSQAVVELSAPPGVTSDRLMQRLSAAERSLADMDGVFSVASATGEAQTAFSPDQWTGYLRPPPDATLLVTFRKAEPPEDLRDRVLTALEGVAGLSAHVFPTGADTSLTDFQVSLLAVSPSQVRAEATALARELSDSLGLTNVTTFPGPSQTTIAVDVDPDAALQANVGTLQLAAQVRQMLQGEPLAEIRLNGGEPLDVVLRVDPAFVNNLERLRSLPVGGGDPTALNAIASVDTVLSPVQVLREDGRFAAVLTGSLLGPQTRALVDSLRDAVAAHQETSQAEVRLTGLPQTRRDALRWLYPGPAIAAALVFAASALLLASLRLSLVVLAGVMAASLGALASLVAFNRPLDLASLSGLTLLPGLASTAAIVFAGALRRVRSRGLTASEALAESARTASLAMVLVAWPGAFLLVTLATGFLPTVPLSVGQATVLAGGLVSASLVGLFALSAVYAATHGSRQKLPAPSAPPPPAQPPPSPPASTPGL